MLAVINYRGALERWDRADGRSVSSAHSNHYLYSSAPLLSFLPCGGPLAAAATCACWWFSSAQLLDQPADSNRPNWFSRI